MSDFTCIWGDQYNYTEWLDCVTYQTEPLDWDQTWVLLLGGNLSHHEPSTVRKATTTMLDKLQHISLVSFVLEHTLGLLTHIFRQTFNMNINVMSVMNCLRTKCEARKNVMQGYNHSEL